MGVILTRSTDIYTCARLLPDVYRSLERKSRRERSLCHLQIISMINCSGNKIPLICVFAAIAIVFIHGLSLAVAPSEPDIREPEARAWATAEREAMWQRRGLQPGVLGLRDNRGRLSLLHHGRLGWRSDVLVLVPEKGTHLPRDARR